MALNPAEGFLLSRIDGHTPWAVLRDLGALLPEEADLALESWLKSGLIQLEETATRTPAAGIEATSAAAPREVKPAGPDLSLVDPSLDIDTDLQKRILEFEARLASASYHEILGVGRDSETREIKRAYFKLSKQYHPDRYFRRNVGDHAVRLDKIFKHVALAYELLSDPTTRSEIERTMTSEPAPSPAEGASAASSAPSSAEPAGSAPPGGYRKPSRMENLEKLRRRFKLPERMLVERRFRAKQWFQASQVATHEKSWLEAAASARLAIAFDPWNREYKEQFASIQAEVHAVRALELLEQANDAGAKGDALKLLEEAIHYRPADAALNARAARLALQTGDIELAREYAESACELDPEDAASQLTLCRVMRRLGDRAAAMKALRTAVKLAPDDPDVVSEQQRLGRK